MFARRLPGFAALLLAAAALAGCARDGVPPERDVGLFTSLPILWRETHDLTQLLASDAPPHWALAVIGERGRVVPLDALADGSGRLPLPPRARLVMAQPRPLSPQENVALDDWVRSGGRVLLFADPMLTAHSAYSLGDRRRPQDIALLSPILRRWGIELQFDEAQPYGEREVALYGGAMPVNLPGRFAIDGSNPCVVEAQGLVARCRIGAGEVVAIADAALLDGEVTEGLEARRAMLAKLMSASAVGD